jgi:hypothetical protein
MRGKIEHRRTTKANLPIAPCFEGRIPEKKSPKGHYKAIVVGPTPALDWLSGFGCVAREVNSEAGGPLLGKLQWLFIVGSAVLLTAATLATLLIGRMTRA